MVIACVTRMSMTDTLYIDALPPGIRSSFIDNGNGLSMHVLEAGRAGQPTALLLHGFPELAYSWRKVMPVLADEGYHVIAPDQRGYGLSTGWDADYDGDLASFRFINLLRDILGLLSAMDIERIEMLVGHWVQQEQPEAVNRLLIDFAATTS
jgi:pimeloyl-ACP methyl ester carboxylesterase